MDLDVINICTRLERVFAASKLSFNPDDQFRSLGDSLALLHLTLDIEFEFNVEIPDEEVVLFETVHDIVLWLSSKS